MCAYVLGSRTEPASCPSTRGLRQLEKVESKLAEVVASSAGTAAAVASHLLEAGGKRIRPALVLLSAGACGGDPDEPKVIDVAAAAELVHTASLVHDDVVDETRERRGVATANDKWGSKVSVLSGDFLLARAFALVGRIDQPEIIEVLASTAVRMTESELLQAECEGSLDRWRDSYWRIINGKTAAFTSACCECGAVLAGAPSVQRGAIADFGANFGIVFQITDDLLDIVGDPTQTGKDIGTDLTHGKFTLPILMACERASGEDLRRLLSACQKGFLSPDEAREAAAIAVKCGAADAARQMSLDYIEKACACLDAVPASDYTSALTSLAHSLADRHR